jgi:hypothetical protein
MMQDIIKVYWSLVKGLLVLAAAGVITSGGVQKAAKVAGQSVRTGLVSLKRLNSALGM